MAVDPSDDPRSRYEMFVDGDLRPQDLDDDEVRLGRFRNIEGNFRGPAQSLPSHVYQQLARELRRRVQSRFERMAFDALDTIEEVMNVGEGEQNSQFQRAGTGRLKAAEMVINRTVGKIPDKLELSDSATPWERQIESGTLLYDIEVDAEDIVEAEIVQEAKAPRRTSARAARARKSTAD